MHVLVAYMLARGGWSLILTSHRLQYTCLCCATCWQRWAWMGIVCGVFVMVDVDQEHRVTIGP